MAPSRSIVTLRCAPLPGPAPAAKTTTSAPSTATAISSTSACSRSHTTGSAHAALTSSAWSGLRISPIKSGPSPVSRRDSSIAIFPWAPAITTRMAGAYRGAGRLTGDADLLVGLAARAAGAAPPGVRAQIDDEAQGHEDPFIPRDVMAGTPV